MEKQNNLKLWNRVNVTAPEHTKQAHNGRFSFTCVDPQWQTMIATEEFGAYGKGWGIRDAKFTMLGGEGLSVPACMMLEATFWYTIDGVECSFPYAVDMKYRAGDDCCKKLMTSLQSKCLSKLGFSSDVYIGLWDDVQYVKDAALKHGSSQVKDAWAKEVISAIDSCSTHDDLQKCRERFDMMISRGTVPSEHVDAINQAIHDKVIEVSV
jgi:pentatricopeptide repeat protein